MEKVYAVKIDCPKHVKLSSEVFPDRIEYKGYNTDTENELIKPFYFKEGESQAMVNLKQLTIVEQLVKEIQQM